jgi:hypothetical protein
MQNESISHSFCRPARNGLNIVNWSGGVNRNQARSPSAANVATARFHPVGSVRNFEIILKNSWDSTDIIFEDTRLAGEGEIPTRVNKVAACGNGK